MAFRWLRFLAVMASALPVRAEDAPPPASPAPIRAAPTRPKPEPVPAPNDTPAPATEPAPVTAEPSAPAKETPATSTEASAVHVEIPPPQPAMAPAEVPSATKTPAPPSPAAEAPAMPGYPRPVESVLEIQVELHRRGFSCGSIDGLTGAQTESALRALQRNAGLRESGVLDAATRDALPLSAPALKEHVLAEEELSGLQPAPVTWLEKSQRDTLGYATALELVAERYRAHPKLLQQLNPGVDWNKLAAGTHLQVPAVERVTLPKNAARILIGLAAHTLEIVDADGNLLAHFPVSIAKMAEKRPVGELHVKVIAPDPNYTFDPVVFPESAEAQSLGRKLILPPGPNNPVGVLWVGLDLTGYGIHGTPDPEKVGRTESHGCFRLANWDARALLGVVKVGMSVIVEP